MREILRVISLFIVGLFVAVFVYPFLHEFGHSIITIMVGAKIVSFNILPLPHMVCDISDISLLGKIMIGWGGVVIPFVFTIINVNKFWLWYGMFLVKVINLYAITVSLVSVVFYARGVDVYGEDIVEVLKMFPSGVILYINILGVMIVYTAISITKENPVLRCFMYLDSKK